MNLFWTKKKILSCEVKGFFQAVWGKRQKAKGYCSRFLISDGWEKKWPVPNRQPGHMGFYPGASRPGRTVLRQSAGLEALEAEMAGYPAGRATSDGLG